MKITLLTIVSGLTASAYAQTFNGVPTCAQPCVVNYLSGTTIAGCNNLDAACICANTSFLAGIACCLSTACSAADQTVAVQFAQNLCKANGVTNLPSAVVCASTAASSATGVASAATTAATTAAKTTASVASNGTVSTGSLSTPIGSVTSSRTSSSSAAASATKNAALAQNVAGMGAGIAGGIAAIVALL